MRLLTDHYVNRDSFFHRWHPTYKLIGHLVLMMGIAVLDDLMAAGIALLMALVTKGPRLLILPEYENPLPSMAP